MLATVERCELRGVETVVCIPATLNTVEFQLLLCAADTALAAVARNHLRPRPSRPILLARSHVTVAS